MVMEPNKGTPTAVAGALKRCLKLGPMATDSHSKEDYEKSYKEVFVRSIIPPYSCFFFHQYEVICLTPKTENRNRSYVYSFSIVMFASMRKTMVLHFNFLHHWSFFESLKMAMPYGAIPGAKLALSTDVCRKASKSLNPQEDRDRLFG